MAAEIKKEIKIEIGHVLFMDIVGYSTRLINEQRALRDALNQIVRATDQFGHADSEGTLIKSPTGDGMALVFRGSLEEPIECALEISRALKAHPGLPLRMGVHSGPVSAVVDVNDTTSVAGAGINIAQRVMDCGDAGHILVSKRVAEDLEQYGHWQPCLHELGECEVKHGVRVRLVNLHTGELGNPQLPKRFQTLKQHETRVHWVRATAILTGVVAIVGLVTWQLRDRAEMKAEMAKLRQGIMNYPHVEAEMRSSQIEQNPAAVQEQTYAEIGKQLGIDPKVLREELPRFAEELKQAPNASLYERATASYVAKHYAEAEDLALQAAGESQKVRPSKLKNVLAALQLAGLSAQKRVDYARAMKHFGAAEKLTDRKRNLEEWATLQHEIADLLTAQGKYSEAEQTLRSVIATRTRILGPDNPDTLDSRHRLIYALTRQTKYPEAESEARAVLKLREKFLGLLNPDTAVSRYNLADTLADQGKYAEAEDLYRDVIRFNEKALGSDHPRTIAARVGLATVLGSQGKNAEAEPLYREVIKLDEKVYGPEDPNTLNDRMNLATALQADGKYSDAEIEYREVIKLDEKVVGAEHPDTLISRNNLAEVLDDDGKFAEAERECRRIIDIETRVLGPENRVTLNSRGNLAIALVGQEKFEDALSQYRDVLRLMEHVLGLEHPDILNYATKFAIALSKQNKIAEAIEIAKGAEDRAREVLGPDHSVTRKYAKLVQDLQASK
jgi:tetratricopeptide (TPR) repeat protein/class 3 adenylate cyclase